MAKILTDAAIKRLVPKETEYKVSDSLGLFLLVKPNGGKYWRFKYRFAGKQKQLAFGVYPERTLAEARDERDAARKLLLNGIDPSFHKQQEKFKTEMAAANTFEAIGEELYERKIKEGKATRTLEKVRWLLDIANASLGKRPITEIQPFEIMTILKKYEAQGGGRHHGSVHCIQIPDSGASWINAAVIPAHLSIDLCPLSVSD